MLFSRNVMFYYRHAPGYNSKISSDVYKKILGSTNKKKNTGYNKDSYENMYTHLGKKYKSEKQK